jgi:hypothetical protein
VCNFSILELFLTPILHRSCTTLHRLFSDSMLEHKLKKIPARAFFTCRKPTIQDIYDDSTGLKNPQYPPECQIGAVFRIWDKFVAARFAARKHDQDEPTTLSIWFWMMDTRHSLSTRHPMVRWNVLPAILVLNGPEAANLPNDLKLFLTRFFQAWERTVNREDWAATDDARFDFISKVWKHDSSFHYIYWNNKDQKTSIKAAIERLAQAMPPKRWDADEFLEHIKDQPEADFEKHGAAWALQYLVYMEDEESWALMLDKQQAADPDEVMEGLKDMGMKDIMGPPDWIDEETFDQPLVRDLMTPISGQVVVLEREIHRAWMSPAAAMHILEGFVYNVDSVTEQMRGTLLT